MKQSDRPIAVLVDREGLGDVMLKRPFLKALKAAFPLAEVWWIATHQTSMEDEVRDLVGSDVARVIAKAGLGGSAREVVARLRALPAFSLVFDARTKVASVALARAFLRHEAFYCCLPGFILCDGRPPRGRRRPRHVGWRMNALIFCATGTAPADPPPLAVGREALEAAREALPEGPRYVGIAPGSRMPAKNWPLDRFLATARDLAAAGLAPVFFLGPQEGIDDEAILAGAPSARVIRAPSGASAEAALERLAADGGRLAALLANDNGVGHLMGAAGTAVISLFGPTDPRRWAPVATRNLALWSRDFGSDEVAAIPAEAATGAVLAMVREEPPPQPAWRGRYGLVERA